MKKIIISALLSSVYLIAADSAISNKSGGFTTIDGATLYKKRCSLCHGKNGQKVPNGSTTPLAGMDDTKLALRIRAYRDQDSNVGSGYVMHKNSQIMKDATQNLSTDRIVKLAKYINNL